MYRRVFQDFEDNSSDVLHSLSEKWLFTQLNHKVSAKATNEFWSLCTHYVPKLHTLWEREGRTKPFPGFINERRKLYSKCPKVEMEFAFRNKHDGSIKIVHTETAPLKEYVNNGDYTKLYEIASIKVIILMKIYSISAKSVYFTSCLFMGGAKNAAVSRLQLRI